MKNDSLDDKCNCKIKQIGYKKTNHGLKRTEKEVFLSENVIKDMLKKISKKEK